MQRRRSPSKRLHKESVLRDLGYGEGYVCVKYKEVYLYSCYFPTSTNHMDFEKRLDELCTDARGKTPVIFAGNFNAWATDWDNKWTNAKGRIVLAFLVSLDMTILKECDVNTFNRDIPDSAIDITMASSALALCIEWGISNIYTHSDHVAIIWELQQSQRANRVKLPLKGPKWKLESLDKELFELMLGKAETRNSVQAAVAEVGARIIKACKGSMTRRCFYKSKDPVYWWTDKIAELNAIERGVFTKDRGGLVLISATEKNSNAGESFLKKRSWSVRKTASRT